MEQIKNQIHQFIIENNIDEMTKLVLNLNLHLQSQQLKLDDIKEIENLNIINDSYLYFIKNYRPTSDNIHIRQYIWKIQYNYTINQYTNKNITDEDLLQFIISTYNSHTYLEQYEIIDLTRMALLINRFDLINILKENRGEHYA